MKVMLYLYLDVNRIKLLYVKKTLLGQYESAFYEKKHAVNFLEDSGTITNTDLLASAIKEAINTVMPNGLKDKEVCLILPQRSFHFMRAEVPADIATSAIAGFVKDKARTSINKDLETVFYDFLIQDNENQKLILFYAIDRDLIKQYSDALSLVELQVVNIVPESLAYFKLFEKTLRRDKKENILYAVYETDQITGHLFDSHGPLDEKWQEQVTEEKPVEGILKEKTTAAETEGKKLNRLILSGDLSDSIRQDTFTKNVGVWTNPLKRIIPQFYQDYLKIFIVPADKTLPILQYDVCIGAFIFTLEAKHFSLMKKRFGSISTPTISTPKLSLPKKEVGIFILSFILSFLTFILVSKANLSNMLPKKSLTLLTKPTMTPTPVPPTPTPTVAVDKTALKVKVLNGSGVKGKATEVKDLLKEQGYEEILTGNAENFDYTTTEIQVKEDKKYLADIVKADIKEHASSPKVTTLADDEASDIVIIFGTDFK